MTGSEERRAAVFAFMSWKKTGRFVKEFLPKGDSRAFVQDLAYMMVRRMKTLRYCLGKLLKTWPLGEAEALLYAGAAQILFMPDVPDYAAVSETVSAAAGCGRSTKGFVNAVLRGLLRRRDAIVAQLNDAGPDVVESFPRKLYIRWLGRFGEEGALELMRWHNVPAETFIAASDGSFRRLERAVRVEDVAGYGEGKFIVQDPGTATAVELVAPREGERILDLCAAPGGKTAQMAWRGAKVTACEVNEKRRETLAGTVSRLGLDVAIVSSPDEAAQGACDKVLVDAPCSNTGVLRRRPEARWSWSGEKMKALAATQAEILDRAAPLVKKGGAIVYSTCSNEPEENSLQVESFLARHPGFELEDERENVPHVSRTDGAYAARIKRK